MTAQPTARHRAPSGTGYENPGRWRASGFWAQVGVLTARSLRTAFGDRRLISRVDDHNRYYELELAPGADAQEVLRRVVATGATIQRFELVLPASPAGGRS